jgi:low temperature requirement protein LtrA
VTSVELFFDLVFVFAITQLSHALLHHLTVRGAAETLLLLLGVWWVWVYTAWCTNWLDPNRLPVRLLLFILMLAGVVLSTAIPEAFGVRGPAFAAAYVFMQLGRSFFMLWALRHHSRTNFRNFQRIVVWLIASSVFWIIGAFFEEPGARFGFWLVALVIEYVSPAVGFHVPGMGSSSTTDWNVAGGHLAERCGLFVIIALGESILVSGSTFTDLAWDATSVSAFVTTFLGTVAMWWIYFNIGAEYAGRKIAESADPGRIGRVAYTYMPIVIIAGIIVTAVGDEMVLTHPLRAEAELTELAAIVGGPALYVFGNGIFKGFVFRRFPLSHIVGLAAFAALCLAGSDAPPMILGALSTAILILVAAWEFGSLRSLRRA